MSVRWVTFFVWAVAAATALFWGLRLGARPLPVPPQAQVADAAAVPRGDLTRLFGADAPPPTAAVPEPAADARFTLLGVVNPRAPQAAREGLALIAVEGKPPRAFRVGAVVDGPHVLQAVNARGATLGPRDGAPVISLTLAPPQPAATGTLPPAGGVSTAPRMPPPSPMPPGVQPLAPLPVPSSVPPQQLPVPPQQSPALPQSARESNLR
jgi:general secretion pathway protein C